MVTPFDPFYILSRTRTKKIDVHLDVNRVIFTVNFVYRSQRLESPTRPLTTRCPSTRFVFCLIGVGSLGAFLKPKIGFG